jgi:hypothetical protein
MLFIVRDLFGYKEIHWKAILMNKSKDIPVDSLYFTFFVEQEIIESFC